MEIVAHGDSVVGLVRTNNEDSFRCGQTVFAVADGLGGHPAGEVASALAIRPVAALEGAEFDSAERASRALGEGVREANRVILSDAREHRAREGMATTLTAALVWRDRLVLAHVGDSRAYLLRGGSLQQLTVDHNAAGEAVQAGHLTPEQAARHPDRHALTRALGLEPEVAVDTPAPVALEPDDRVLLCTDGLTGVVGDDDVADVLGRADGPENACSALVAAALAGGAPDNVTVVVVDARAG